MNFENKLLMRHDVINDVILQNRIDNKSAFNDLLFDVSYDYFLCKYGYDLWMTPENKLNEI